MTRLPTRTFLSELSLCASVLALVAASSTPLQAASVYWSGGASNDWFNANNWAWDGVVPGAADQVRIENSTTALIGAGSNATAGIMYIGISTGQATLTVNGGLISTDTYLAFNAGPTATVTVDGANASWTNNGIFAIGAVGTGIVNVKNGADLISGGALIGGNAPGNLGVGTVNVDGTGSSWQASDRIMVGHYGDGTLNITGGATVSSTGGLVGSQIGSTGHVTIDGAGSSWTATGDGLAGRGTIQIGNESNGYLSVLAGGAISDVDGYVGSEAGSTSTATISGTGSSWTNSRDFFVGHNSGAVGTVTLAAGGTLSGVNVQVGNLAGSNGTMIVTGAGSTLTATGDLNIGWHGTGSLTVQDGGRIVANTGHLYIANESDATGVLNIGAAAGSAAAAAGIIDASAIRFGDGTGSIVFNATDASYTLGARILGGGSLDMYAGNLTLTGDNTYSGGTHVRTGVLTLGSSTAAGSGVITLENNTTLAYGSGTTIANALAINGVVDLQVASGTATQVGNLSIAANGLYRLRGNGVLAFNGTTTTTTGQTSVSDGTTISVNGTLTGAVDVGNNGTLKGNGTVGSTTVNSGGTLAPGNSIGTLNVAGDVTFNPGSVYQVEANAAGSSDKIIATGTAFLNGGTVDVLPASGAYAPSTVYTILTAGLINGSFADVTSSLAFLTPVLSSDAQNVYLTLTRNASSFASVGRTPNQIASAAGLETMSNITIANAVVGLTGDDARAAFDGLSGELYASTSNLLLEQSALPRQSVLRRIDQAFDDVGAVDVLSYGDANLAPATTADTGIWGNVYGIRQNRDGNGNAANASSTAGGLSMGVDGLLSDWRLGATVHAGASAINVADRNSSAQTVDYGLGLYGGRQWGATRLSFGAAYTRHQISAKRNVSFPGFSNNLVADYSAGTTQLFGELSHQLDFGSTKLTPFAGLAYVHEATDGFTETGGLAALTSASRAENAVFTTLGLRAEHSFALTGGTLLTASASAGWRHAFADKAQAQSSLPTGTPFAVQGVPVVADALEIGAGLNLDLDGDLAVSANYEGQLSTSANAHTVKFGMARQF